MKALLAALCLLAGSRLTASAIVTFGEKDAFVLGSNGSPPALADAGRQAFAAAFAADVTRAAPLERSLDLVNPPVWGKTVGADSGGLLQFHAAFNGGFVCHAALHHLAPNHDYILTLNGNPAKAGNALLPMPVPGNPQERYFDFLIVRTDSAGSFEANLGISLKPGHYFVRWYVKDTSDFKIVLYHDFFEFDVLDSALRRK